MPTKNHILVFDLDNTLILRNEAMLTCIEMVFKLSLSVQQKQSIKIQDQSGHSNRLHFCTWLKTYLQLPFPSSEIWQLIHSHIGNFVVLNKSAKMVLAQLQGNYELVLLTNGGTTNQLRKIEKTKLTAFFPTDRIFISEQMGVKKPRPEAFQLIEKLFPKHSRFCMIGDHWEKDILGAINVGWKGVYLTHETQPKALANVNNITTLTDLNKVLHELND